MFYHSSTEINGKKANPFIKFYFESKSSRLTYRDQACDINKNTNNNRPQNEYTLITKL